MVRRSQAPRRDWLKVEVPARARMLMGTNARPGDPYDDTRHTTHEEQA